MTVRAMKTLTSPRDGDLPKGFVPHNRKKTRRRSKSARAKGRTSPPDHQELELRPTHSHGMDHVGVGSVMATVEVEPPTHSGRDAAGRGSMVHHRNPLLAHETNDSTKSPKTTMDRGRRAHRLAASPSGRHHVSRPKSAKSGAVVETWQ